MDTFVLTHRPDLPTFSQELPLTSVTGHPYLEHVAMLAVQNRKGSGKVVRVREVRVDQIAAQTTTTQTNLQVQTVSAATGGAAVSPWALDSGNAALPAQVSFVRDPATVTLTNVVVNDVPIVYGANMATALRRLNRATVPLRPVFGWCDAATAETQRIVLREGQGLALHSGGGLAVTFRLEVSVWVRVVSTGAVYLYRVNGAPAGLAVFALVNGSGSGVVLEVLSVTVGEVGEDVLPQFTVEQIDALDDSAAAPTVVPMDSTAGLPALVVCRERVLVQSEGAKHGALMVVPQRTVVAGGYAGRGPGLAVAARPFPLLRPIWREAARDATAEWVIREGEGFGVFQRTASALGAWNVTATITVEASGGGGGGTFPAVGDVELGVVYGPTDDLTGTLVVPAAGDVESGVGFGAGGTEFTGSFAAPAAGDVQSGVGFGNAGEFTGTLVVPATGDVDQGVGYGAAGTEFTGTLEQPVEADVRVGTGFGENGTEFTGTLAPGGGGGGTVYLRRGR